MSFFNLWIITIFTVGESPPPNISGKQKRTSKLNNGGFNKWLETLAGKDLQTKLRKSCKIENIEQRHSEGKRCQLQTEAIQRPRICKETARRYYNYTANNDDVERKHRLPMFQENAVSRIRNETEERQVNLFTVKIIFFDATIGSKNYTICKIDMRSIFQTDWGQKISLFTVLQ